jgi:hypothetical protein
MVLSGCTSNQSTTEVARSTANAQSNTMGCRDVVDMTRQSGKTFASFIAFNAKPHADRKWDNAFTIAPTSQLLYAYERARYQVQANVRNQLGLGWGANYGRFTQGEIEETKAKLKVLGDAIAGKRARYTVYRSNGVQYQDCAGRGAEALSCIISDASRVTGERYNGFKLQYFIALASCAGSTIYFAPQNFAYNISYAKDMYSVKSNSFGGSSSWKAIGNKTGRSYSEGPGGGPEDASYENYLKGLQAYLAGRVSANDTADINLFYRTLFNVLIDTDGSAITRIFPKGQVIMGDFLAVYIAEQIRNLMDGQFHVHWDAAHLETTLLGAFHSGQSQLTMFYKDFNPNATNRSTTWTNQVMNQSQDAALRSNANPRSSYYPREARLYDYWQLGPTGSGVNKTKRQFRKLGQLITKYIAAKDPALVDTIFGLMVRASSTETATFYKSRTANGECRGQARISQENRKKMQTSDFNEYYVQVGTDCEKVNGGRIGLNRVYEGRVQYQSYRRNRPWDNYITYLTDARAISNDNNLGLVYEIIPPGRTRNVFAILSEFFISSDKKIPNATNSLWFVKTQLVDALVRFLEISRTDANEITRQIGSGQLR